MTNGLEKLGEALLSMPELLKEVYGDLAKPGVAEVGKALGGIMGLGNTILIPIHLMNEKGRIFLQSNMEKYRDQLKNQNIEDVVPVLPEIGVPLLEKMMYVSSEELSDMYIKLLTNASTKNGLMYAHPAFVNAVVNMTNDEAKFLQNYHKNVINSSVAFVFIDYEYFFSSHINGAIENKDQLPLYIHNLEALGIMRVKFKVRRASNEIEKILEDNRQLIADRRNLMGKGYSQETGIVEITPFGHKFINSMSV